MYIEIVETTKELVFVQLKTVLAVERVLLAGLRPEKRTIFKMKHWVSKAIICDFKSNRNVAPLAKNR